jgi:5-methylcytosine-specific restriction enzyme subunit McrC
MGRERAHVLRERVTTECPLSSADVAFLRAEHRPHVKLTPTARHGRYLLTPTGHIGTIIAPDCRLVIQPKIPIRNLFILLDPAVATYGIEDRRRPVPGTAALDFLAGQLSRLLDERAAAGLHRAYIERAAQGSYVQGRIDLPAQLREPGFRKDRIHSRYDDFSADVPCNQIPKATAELVVRSPLVGELSRQALQRSLQALGGITAARLGSDSFAEAELSARNADYQPLLDLCRLLVQALSPGTADGDTCCPAFLLNMDRVFERYVTRIVTMSFSDSGFAVEAQQLYSANRPTAGQPDILLRPDMVVRNEGECILIVDAKWKACKGTPWIAEDLHQAMAYGAALGVRRVALVYPGRHDRCWHYPLARTTQTVELYKLRVVGRADACLRSQERLRNRLKRGLLSPKCCD